MHGSKGGWAGGSGGLDPPGKVQLILNSRSNISKTQALDKLFQTHLSLEPPLENFSGSMHDANKGLPI